MTSAIASLTNSSATMETGKRAKRELHCCAYPGCTALLSKKRKKYCSGCSSEITRIRKQAYSKNKRATKDGI